MGDHSNAFAIGICSFEVDATTVMMVGDGRRSVARPEQKWEHLHAIQAALLCEQLMHGEQLLEVLVKGMCAWACAHPSPQILHR